MPLLHQRIEPDLAVEVAVIRCGETTLERPQPIDRQPGAVLTRCGRPVEISQIKGDSECRNDMYQVLGATDEFCTFEEWRGPEVEDCEEGTVPMVDDAPVISWSPVTHSHPEVGRPGPIEIVKYEVDVERDEPTPLILSFNLSPEVTQVAIPAGLFEPGDVVKFQVLAGDAGGNETSSESCFEVM